MTDAAISPAHTYAEEQTAAIPATVDASFPDLVWAHFEWDTQRRHDHRVDPEVEQRYRRTLKAFEAEYGEIVNAYWSQSDASAVAVTVKQTAPWRYNEMRFHRVTDWVTRSVPAIPDALNRCETLAMKAQEVLRGTSEQITIQWIYSVASHLLGFIERSEGKPHEGQARHAATSAERELEKLEKYYDLAGMKTGRIVYTTGMIWGVLALVGIAAFTWIIGVFNWHTEGTQTFFACYAAGALGALVSVMSRMASARNEWVVDYEVGRPALRFLGSVRPLVGAIFGLAGYFAVKAGIFQVEPTGTSSSPFYWYTSLSFLAGFSERFTKVLGDSADRMVPGGGKLTAKASSSAQPPPEPPPAAEELPSAATAEG
jgi:hypothetical protein